MNSEECKSGFLPKKGGSPTKYPLPWIKNYACDGRWGSRGDFVFKGVDECGDPF